MIADLLALMEGKVHLGPHLAPRLTCTGVPLASSGGASAADGLAQAAERRRLKPSSPEAKEEGSDDKQLKGPEGDYVARTTFSVDYSEEDMWDLFEQAAGEYSVVAFGKVQSGTFWWTMESVNYTIIDSVSKRLKEAESTEIFFLL